MKCLEECIKNKQPCKQNDCRHWIDYKEDMNCLHESIDKHGTMTLREVADRLGVSFVRIKQIEDKAMRKLNKLLQNSTKYNM